MNDKHVTKNVRFRGTEEQLAELLRIFAEHGVEATVDTVPVSDSEHNPDLEEL